MMHAACHHFEQMRHAQESALCMNHQAALRDTSVRKVDLSHLRCQAAACFQSPRCDANHGSYPGPCCPAPCLLLQRDEELYQSGIALGLRSKILIHSVSLPKPQASLFRAKFETLESDNFWRTHVLQRCVPKKVSNRAEQK